MKSLKELLAGCTPSQDEEVVDAFIASNAEDVTDMLCSMMMAGFFPSPTPSGKFDGELCLFFRDDRWPLVHFKETARTLVAENDYPFSYVLLTDLSPEVTRLDTLKALQHEALPFLVSARMVFRRLTEVAGVAEGPDYDDRLHELAADVEALNRAFDHVVNERLAFLLPKTVRIERPSYHANKAGGSAHEK